MAPSLHQSLWSDVTPKGRGLRLGPCLAHLATPADFGPFWANGDPTEQAALESPHRWVATTRPPGCAPVLVDSPGVPGASQDEVICLSEGPWVPPAGERLLASSASLAPCRWSTAPSVPPPGPSPDTYPHPSPQALGPSSCGCHSAPPLQEPTGAPRGRCARAALEHKTRSAEPLRSSCRWSPHAGRGAWARLGLPGRRATPMAGSAPPSRLRDIRFPLPEKFGESGFGVDLGVVPAPPAFCPFQRPHRAQPHPFFLS